MHKLNTNIIWDIYSQWYDEKVSLCDHFYRCRNQWFHEIGFFKWMNYGNGGLNEYLRTLNSIKLYHCLKSLNEIKKSC